MAADTLCFMEKLLRITADSCTFAIYRRKRRPRFTVVFRVFAFYRRKLRP